MPWSIALPREVSKKRYVAPFTRPQKMDIVAAATGAGRLTMLVQAVRVAGLLDTLRGEGPFTLFGPSDAAFARIPTGRREALLADTEALTHMLRSHIVPGRISAADIIRYGESTSQALNGRRLSVAARSGRIYVGGALVARTDILASNGVIHELEDLLLPEFPSVVWPSDRATAD